MRNRAGFIVAAVIMLLAIGGISIMSVNSAKNSDGISFSLGGRAELRNTIELSLSEIDSLDVVYTSKNLKLFPGKGDKVVIKEYLISERESALAQVTREGRTATVTGGRELVITIFGFFTGTERIEIYVPEEGLKELGVQTGSGNITAEDGFFLNTGTLQVRAGSGNIKWRDTAAAEYDIHTGSGNINAENMEGDGSVQAGSGNVYLRKAKGRLSLNTKSGNIHAEDFSGWGSMEAGSGNVKVEAVEVTGDMRLRAASGNVRLLLPRELSFSVKMQTTSGVIRTSFEEALSYNKKGNQAEGKVGEAPSCSIEALTGSGNVHVDYR